MVAPPNFRRGARRTWHQVRRHALVERLVEGLGGDLLDYGAGWGDICRLVAPRFRRVLGVDVSADRVAFATTQHPELEFRTCRPDGLDEPDASFDVVLSIVVANFAPDPVAYLRECARVLRPGGTLVLVVPNQRDFMELLYRAVGRQWNRCVRIPERQELEAELGALGFTIEVRDGFFDPPFDRTRNPAEVALAACNIVGHALGPVTRASYLGYRCRLGGSAP